MSKIEEILSSLEFSILWAENGKDALSQLIAHDQVDLIITDIHMPELNGLELVEEIRSVDLNTPIIILTVNSEMETAVEAIRKGADDYILKGSSIGETLPLSIAKVMEIHDLREENRLLLKDLTTKNAELEKLAFLDGLTSLFNRRYYDVMLPEKWRTAAEQKSYISMIMTDIDHFKQLNDSLGHQYGDLCLQKVAKILNRNIMDEQGVAARFGGDEFVALLPGKSPQETAAIAERVLIQVAKAVVIDPDSGESKQITMSFGVYGSIPSKESTVDLLFDGADRALYDAKESGRNRVCIAT